MLTSKQRAQLRGMASTMDTIVIVGKGGITENVIAQVRDALKGWTVVRLQAEDIDELLALPDFSDIHGLPAFVVFE